MRNSLSVHPEAIERAAQLLRARLGRGVVGAADEEEVNLSVANPDWEPASKSDAAGEGLGLAPPMGGGPLNPVPAREDIADRSLSVARPLPMTSAREERPLMAPLRPLRDEYVRELSAVPRAPV